VTERGDLVAGCDRREATDSAARSVFEEYTLHGIPRAILEHLVARRLGDSHRSILL
jgi:hypothetical protein